MVKKLKNFMLALTLVGVGTLSFASIAHARVVAPINFWLPAYQGVGYTPYAKKAATGGTSIVNLTKIGGASTALEGLLVNSNGSARSNYAYNLKVARNAVTNYASGANAAQAGYDYRFKLINSISEPYSIEVAGSWSPDAQ